jgi:hypothetical protein
VSVALLLLGVGSVQPGGRATAAVFDKLPTAEALIVPVTV